MRGIITASARRERRRQGRNRCASLRHGTGGIVDVTRRRPECSQAPMISGIEALRWFPVAPSIYHRAYIARTDGPIGPCVRSTAPVSSRTVSDTERIHEHEQPRAPEHQPEPARGSRRPTQGVRLQRRQSARSAARSRALRARGSCPAARSIRASSRRSTPRAAAARRSIAVSGEALTLARRPLGCPRAHRLGRARPQPRRRGARVRDRHRRVLRARTSTSRTRRTATA